LDRPVKTFTVKPPGNLNLGLTVLTVASTDMQLFAPTKSLSPEFRLADERANLATRFAKFSRHLCHGCDIAASDPARN
jgi:hypothetical protein